MINVLSTRSRAVFELSPNRDLQLPAKRPRRVNILMKGDLADAVCAVGQVGRSGKETTVPAFG